MNSTRVIFTAVLLAALLAGGLVFGASTEKSPGYFDLEWIKIPADAEEIQDIDLQAALKGLAADAEKSGDSELAKLLSMIKSVRVIGYSVDKHTAAGAEESVKKVQQMLEEKGWERMIYVKGEEETVTVNTMSAGGQMVGLTAVIYEPDEEITFVNVSGTLDLITMLGLAKSFDEDHLEDVLEGLKEKDYHDD